MKQKEGFKLRHVGNEHIVVAEGLENIDFSKIISLNDSASMLWESMEGKEFTAQSLADLLAAHYEVDAETALADAEALVKSWLQAEIICE